MCLNCPVWYVGPIQNAGWRWSKCSSKSWPCVANLVRSCLIQSIIVAIQTKNTCTCLNRVVILWESLRSQICISETWRLTPSGSKINMYIKEVSPLHFFFRTKPWNFPKSSTTIPTHTRLKATGLVAIPKNARYARPTTPSRLGYLEKLGRISKKNDSSWKPTINSWNNPRNYLPLKLPSSKLT